jgi:hypothetical protein
MNPFKVWWIKIKKGQVFKKASGQMRRSGELKDSRGFRGQKAKHEMERCGAENVF